MIETYDAEIKHVANAGLKEAGIVLNRLRTALRKALTTGVAPKVGATSSRIMHDLVPTLARTMAAANGMGQVRAKRESLAANGGLELDWFSTVMKDVRDAGVGLNLTKEQKGYARRVYDSMRHMGAEIDGRTRATIASLIADKIPLPKAMKVLDSVLDKLGVGPHSRGKLETIYRTESSVAYYAGRWEQDQKDPNVWGYRYLQIDRPTKRDEHVPLHGTTLPKNALFWKRYWPPNGWNCGCHIQTLYKKVKEVLPGKIDGKVPAPDKGFKQNWKDLGAIEFSWNEADHPRKPSGDTHGGEFTIDLHKIADVSLPKDTSKYEYFYHAVRYESDIDSILKEGLKPQIGKHRSSDAVFLSKDEIRDRNAGFLIVRVPRGEAKESVDFVEKGLTYRQWDVPLIPAHDIVRAIRMVTDSTGFKIREDELAAYAIKNPNSPDANSLPLKYRKWFKGIELSWNEADHPRVDAGNKGGGQFTKKDSMPTSLSDLKHIKALGGSTGASLYEDKNGNKFVVKGGASIGHAENEVKANKLYRILGVLVPETSLIDGKLVSRFVEGKTLNEFTKAEQELIGKKLSKDFAVDALLGNWDVIGLNKDNIVVDKDGNPWRIDNGGALAYRAKGAPKGAKWNADVSELATMQQKDVAGSVFGPHLTYLTTKEQVKNLANKIGTIGHNKFVGDDKILSQRVDSLILMLDQQKPWPWKLSESPLVSSPVPVPQPKPLASKPVSKVAASITATNPDKNTSPYWKKFEELKDKVNEDNKWTDHQLLQAAILNHRPQQKKVFVNWYWTEEQQKEMAGLYPDKKMKVVESPKMIKKIYGKTTKDLANELHDPGLGVVKNTKKVVAQYKPATPAFKEPETWHPVPTEKVSIGGIEINALKSGHYMETKTQTGNYTKELGTSVKLASDEYNAIGSWKGSCTRIRAAQLHTAGIDPKDSFHNMNSEYKKLLAPGGDAGSPYLQKKKKAFEDGVANLHKYDGISYRGVRHIIPGTEYHKVLTTPGSTVEMLTHACTSREPIIAHSFSGGHTIFRIRAKSGAIAEDIYSHKNEREVIMPRGTTFKVLRSTSNVYMPGAGKVTTVVDLEEVEPHKTAIKIALSRIEALALAQENRRETQFTEDQPGLMMILRRGIDDLLEGTIKP